MAWTVLFKNQKSGGTPGFLEFLLGAPTPDWLAYGAFPIIVSSALHYYTFFFLFVSAALLSVDSSLEEAGELAGAGRWRIMRKITLPLVVPAIASGFHHDIFQDHGHIWRPERSGSTDSVLHPIDHASLQYRHSATMATVLSWRSS